METTMKTFRRTLLAALSVAAITCSFQAAAQDFKPRIIMVTPSYMQVIIEEYTRQGLDARDSSLQIGILGAEPWTNAMRRDIEAAAGLDAVDIYGLSEVMGPGVA
eukprot:gene46665-62418_t